MTAAMTTAAAAGGTTTGTTIGGAMTATTSELARPVGRVRTFLCLSARWRLRRLALLACAERASAPPHSHSRRRDDRYDDRRRDDRRRPARARPR
eukprot:1502747-Prymnesium_polylepis.1